MGNGLQKTQDWTGELCDYTLLPVVKDGQSTRYLLNPLVRRDINGEYIAALVRFVKIYNSLFEKGWKEVSFA
jgi:hypothetical protein